VSRRSYATGVERALFAVSRGHCYVPTCRRRVVQLVDGEPIVDVHIAHICAQEPNGARYDPTMTDEERRDYSNVILVCTPHHKQIDRKSYEHKFPVELLRTWKREREGDFADQLKGLDDLTEDKLQSMMTEAIHGAKSELIAGIDELAAVSKEAAEMLRSLVAETFERPYLDLDAVASLAQSARMLSHLQDSAYTLNNAAWALIRMEGQATILHDAAQAVTRTEGQVYMLQGVAKSLIKLGDKAELLHSVAEQISKAVNQHVTGPSETTGVDAAVFQQLLVDVGRIEQVTRSFVNNGSDRQHWNYFKWGLGLGASAVVIAVILIALLIHNAH